MSQDAEAVSIDLQALGDIKDETKAMMLSAAFRGASEEEKQLLPITLRMHEAWRAGEAERILAFFMRDNDHVPIDLMRQFLGLNTLNWASPMMQDAIKKDDYAKMLVMMYAGEDLGQPDVVSAFNESFEAGRTSHLILLAVTESSALAKGLGERWADIFTSLTQKGSGKGYLAGQALIGMMYEEEPEAFEAGLPTAIEGHLKEGREPDMVRGYLTEMAKAFVPQNASQQSFHALVVPAWDEY